MGPPKCVATQGGGSALSTSLSHQHFPPGWVDEIGAPLSAIAGPNIMRIGLALRACWPSLACTPSPLA